ncbi:MAG: hypothetical protein IJS35_03590, partial [Firmicutes bacterium]|nr:hypothetical protein [Bacillota bacterium]
SLLEANRKADEPKIAFIKECMPDRSNVEGMLEDIVSWYEQHFAPLEIRSSDGEITVRIRFFINKKAKKRSGDAISDEIRIFVRNFPDVCKRMVSDFGTFSEIVEEISYGKALWFENYLRYILAHELFHILHGYHYKKQTGEQITKNTVSSTTYDTIGCILMEVFAEYFAVAYLKDYFKKTFPEEGTRMLNHIIEFGNTRLFGIGRKKLLEGRFDPTEIKEDEKQWKDLRENKHYAGSFEIDPERLTCGADYYGAYVLSLASGRYYDGKQGIEMPDYVSAYDHMLKGERDTALADLICLKEKIL